MLVDQIVQDPDVRHAINELLDRKQHGQELDREPRIPAISDYIEHQLERLASLSVEARGEPRDSESLNELFRWMIQTVWS